MTGDQRRGLIAFARLALPIALIVFAMSGALRGCDPIYEPNLLSPAMCGDRGGTYEHHDDGTEELRCGDYGDDDADR